MCCWVTLKSSNGTTKRAEHGAGCSIIRFFTRLNAVTRLSFKLTDTLLLQHFHFMGPVAKGVLAPPSDRMPRNRWRDVGLPYFRWKTRPFRILSSPQAREKFTWPPTKLQSTL